MFVASAFRKGCDFCHYPTVSAEMYGGVDKYSGDIAFQKREEEVDVQ